MEPTDVLLGSIKANKAAAREAIIRIKEEDSIPIFLEFLEQPASVSLYEKIIEGVEESHPNRNLITAIVLHNEAAIHLTHNRFGKAISALLSSSYAIGRFVGGTEQKSNLATSNAKKRHIETYKLRDEVILFWHQNIDPALSADKAAGILAKTFSPLLSFRKLSEYVSAEKKLRAASRA